MKAIFQIARKDLRTELRGREVATGMVLLAFLSGLIGAAALAGVGTGSEAVAAVLWITVGFATMLGVARATAAELDRGTWEALLLLPVDRGVIFAGKTVSNVVLVLVATAVVLPTYAVFGGYAPSWSELATLVPVVLLAVVGTAMAATVFAVLAMQARGREALLPVLLAPILTPLLFTAVTATVRALDGVPLTALQGELTLMAGYDIAFFALAYLLFERAVEG